MRIKVDKLDVLFSRYIRMRAIQRVGGCERCLTPKYDIQKENGDIFPAWKQLDCSHLLGRWKGSIRWDESNAIGACGGCHLTLDRDHTEKESFIIRHLGQEGYDFLRARARQIGRVDEKLIELYLKEQLNSL